MYATHSEAFLAHCGDVLMGLIELLEEIFGWPKKKGCGQSKCTHMPRHAFFIRDKRPRESKYVHTHVRLVAQS